MPLTPEFRVTLPRFVSLGLAILLACGPQTDARQPSLDESAPPGATPPAAFPEPEGAWVLAATGAGPIRFGMSLVDALPLLDGGVDTTMLAEGCGLVRATGAPTGLSFMVENGRVVRADVVADTTPTVEGARIGDTEQRILDQYPGARRVPHKYTDGSYLIVTPSAPLDTLHRYVFETDGTHVTRYRAGILPAVEYVESCG